MITPHTMPEICFHCRLNATCLPSASHPAQVQQGAEVKILSKMESQGLHLLTGKEACCLLAYEITLKAKCGFCHQFASSGHQ